MNNFELRPFRIWCQKVLPLVYDESLSYYELLCKVLKHLNLTIEDVNEIKKILEGDGSIDELVAEAVKKLMDLGVIGMYEADTKFTVNPIFDFNDFADDIYKMYKDTDLADWNAVMIERLWDELMYANIGIPDKYSSMYKVNAFEVENGVYSPAYVWKARKNYQTTHLGKAPDPNGEDKFGMTKYGVFANEVGGEPTFLITIGDRGGDKNAEATFYHLFKAWTEGKYNGDYILNTYNFIILPLINYLGQNGVQGKSDYLRNNFNCGYTGFTAKDTSATGICGRIETFFDSGVRSIIESITGETITSNEVWKYNQNIVHLNLANFTWMDNATYVDTSVNPPVTKYYHDDEDEFGYGIIFRGHCTRENYTEKILFDACMSVVEQVKKFAPKLYAGNLPEGTSQVHIGNNSYHSIVSASAQFGYKSLNIELPRAVGETWREYTSVRNANGSITPNTGNMNTRNTFYLDLLGIYNGVISAMNYFELPINRVYENLMSLGFWAFNGGLDADGNYAVDEDENVIPYKKINVNDIFKRVPPGSVCEFSIPQSNYPTNAGEGVTTHLADMTKFYENLPSNRGGLLTIHRGKNYESLIGKTSSRRGKAEYMPAYGTYQFMYARIDNDGAPSPWRIVAGTEPE